MQTHSVYIECVGQEQGKEEDQPQHVPSSAGFAMHMDENEEPVITRMRLLYMWKNS